MYTNEYTSVEVIFSNCIIDFAKQKKSFYYINNYTIRRQQNNKITISKMLYTKIKKIV